MKNGKGRSNTVYKYKKIFNCVNGAIFIADTTTGRILDCNICAEKLIGLSKNKIIGMHQSKLHPAGEGEKYKKKFEEHISKRSTHDYEGAIKNHRGENIPVMISAETMNIFGKKIIVGFFVDISDIKKTEKLSALGALSGAVSHELRNPLGVIANAAHFIKMRLGGIKDEKVKKHIKIIDEEVKTAEKIINDLLSVAQIKDPHLADTDVNELIRNILKKTEIPENVKVETEFKRSLRVITADGVQLAQAVSNIIRNSIEAMPQGGTLTVRSAQCTANSEQKKTLSTEHRSLFTNYVEISIRDTGAGISKENLEKIFDPLFSTKGHGTGFGLTISQYIIEKHGGKIYVKSSIGKGTKTLIKLPINCQGN